jgi:cation diffusion facilitator family transporter
MLNRIADWLGFGARETLGPGDDHHRHGAKGHVHGVVDPTLATTATGIWAIKWSFVILAVTATLQLVVVFVSGSVALLADTIHNFGDATTAIPLWIAFVLGRRKPSRTFPYGLGRAEDLAGLAVVLIILASAIVAGYEAVDRLVHPQAIGQIGWVAIAGVIGFVGNEAVAAFRIRVGRAINSAALIADGYHARTDGLTSLAVVLGAAGVWFGFPLADPIVGLLITLAILGIVWQSARVVLTRMLDGVEPEILTEIEHAAAHVAGIEGVADVKARWLGHRLHADVTIAIDEAVPFAAANQISAALREELLDHLPALASANVLLVPVATEAARLQTAGMSERPSEAQP